MRIFSPRLACIVNVTCFGSFGLSACSDNNEDTLAVIDTAEQTQPATPNLDGNTETDADATTVRRALRTNQGSWKAHPSVMTSPMQADTVRVLSMT